MNLNKLRDEAYSIAKANGWHEEEHNDSHWLIRSRTSRPEKPLYKQKEFRSRLRNRRRMAPRRGI